MSSLPHLLKRGQVLREQLSQPAQPDAEPSLPNPQTHLGAHLTERARRQLVAWNTSVPRGTRFDFAAERLRLIDGFVETMRSPLKGEYRAGHEGTWLARFNGDEREPLDASKRHDLIVDTLARFLWLEKRHDPSLNLMSHFQAHDAALAALEAELARRGAAR